MFEDFEFEENKFNPWDVQSLEEFRYYCCPACPFKNVNKTDFINHAVSAHPQSQSVIESLEDNKNVIKTENTSSTTVSEPLTAEFNHAQNVGYKEADAIENDFLLSKKVVVSLPKLSETIIRKYTTVQYNCDPEEISEDGQGLENVEHVDFYPESPSKYKNKYTKTYEKKNFELSSKTYLKRNVKSFHENVRHKCEKCNKGFSLKGHLKTHIQSAHENVYKEGQFECTHKKCT